MSSFANAAANAAPIAQQPASNHFDAPCDSTATSGCPFDQQRAVSNLSQPCQAQPESTPDIAYLIQALLTQRSGGCPMLGAVNSAAANTRSAY